MSQAVKTPMYLQYTDTDGSIQSLYFDLAFQESTKHSSEVTTYPVESGANVADHVRIQPTTFNAKVFVSNTPIADVLDFSRGGLEQAVTLGGGPSGKGPAAGRKAMVWQFNSSRVPDGDFIVYTYNQLQNLHDNHVLVTVITALASYVNMEMTELGLDRDKDTSGDGATFDIGFSQLTIVNSEVVNQALLPDAKKEEQEGAEETDDEDDDTKESLLHKWNDSMESNYAGDLGDQ